MTRILQINSSARPFENGQGSHSSRLAHELVEQLREVHPGAQVQLRDLARQPQPVLDEAALQALFTPAEARTPEQAARAALDEALIAEVQAADVLVLGVPMYNFSVSAQFKNWIDAIVKARVTFRYTEQGVEGLLKGKTAYVVLSRGGKYRDQPADSQVPYLRTVLSFVGITDVHFIYAEGLAMGPEAEAAGLADARVQMQALLAASAIHA